MRMFELLPRPLGSIFRKLTRLACNSRSPRLLQPSKSWEIKANAHRDAPM